MQTTDDFEVPSLNRSRRFATLALVIAILSWLGLMVIAKLAPEYAWLIHILMLAAEAGVVGGLADWYAITVLFRNPFGKIPLPKLLRDHTAIIPRNKARIAVSMGRFVQENFLSPVVVEKALTGTDVSLAAGHWLSTEKNSLQITHIVQQTTPKLLDFISDKKIAQFIQQNSVEWLKNTQFNLVTSELLRAVLDNDFHQNLLQHSLDGASKWINNHPEKAYAVAESIIEEMGVSVLVKGVSLFGIDVQQKAINGLLEKIEQILSTPDHPFREQLENTARQFMADLKDQNSVVSIKLNETKNVLLDNPQMINFISHAILILRDAVKRDLESTDSGLASNLNAVVLQVGNNLIANKQVRIVINQQILKLGITFSNQYADRIIRFISERIHEWDSGEMIDKIENEVGGDLHMIRVNGVVVGAFIGLILGIIRALVDLLF